MTIFKYMNDKTIPEGLANKDDNDINMLIENMMREIDFNFSEHLMDEKFFALFPIILVLFTK